VAGCAQPIPVDAPSLMAAIRHPTLRLLRVRIGNFWLGDLPAGQWKILSVEEGESVLSQK
jgi:16S rRNA U516 pseudouridylate synthase RsuA-like enzyme